MYLLLRCSLSFPAVSLLLLGRRPSVRISRWTSISAWARLLLRYRFWYRLEQGERRTADRRLWLMPALIAVADRTKAKDKRGDHRRTVCLECLWVLLSYRADQSGRRVRL